MRIQFSVRRFLLAMIVFTVFLAGFNALGLLAVVPWLAILCAGSALAIILLAQKHDIPRILLSGLLATFGAFLATPLLMTPGCGPGTVFTCGAFGAVTGWALGCSLARLDERLAARRARETRSPNENDPPQ